MTTMTYTGALTVTSCWCGIRLAIPDSLYREAADRKPGTDVWCPLGHVFVYGGDSESKKLRDELRRERDRLVAERARADGAEASLRTTKGHVTRLRKRVLEGECPLCGQHLRDVARHVARVHPGETAEGEA